MSLEEGIVIVLVVTALLYLGVRFFKGSTKDDCCGGCGKHK